MDIQQVCVSSALSGSLVALLCTPFDVVKNYWQYTAIASPAGTAAAAAAAAPDAAAASGPFRCSPTAGSAALHSGSSSSRAGQPSAKVGGASTHMSSLQVATKLYRAKGPLIFWRGVGPAVGVLVPANIIFFTLYERRDPEGSAAVAGVAARTAAVICTAPIELVRTQVQARCCGGDSKPAAISLIRETIKAEGIGGLFKGVVPTIIRDAPFSAFYWPLTTATTRFFRRLLVASEGSGDSSESSSSSTSVQRFRDGAVIPFLSGASSAAVACVLTHPFDVVKTRVQASQLRPQGPSGAASGGPLWYFFRGVREACTEVYGANGFRGFGVGLLPRLLKIVPSCAVLLATYEATKALCGSSLLDQT
ncbi:solute carrier family 25 member 39 [Cyclospora cayetanensis]|uniref:Solute carrier family 25 member 39 n=1 Tax=Cyclospora cayetanensis TaxID=88456 RepID=A0A6P6RYW0_9EIME|nr:solute carrier family 25 member 39 [Cyclospora cayetanensis]